MDSSSNSSDSDNTDMSSIYVTKRKLNNACANKIRKKKVDTNLKFQKEICTCEIYDRISNIDAEEELNHQDKDGLYSSSEDHSSDEENFDKSLLAGDFNLSSENEELSFSDFDALINKKLYLNSHIRVYDFNILFLKVVSKLGLPETSSNLLLEFCRNIVPAENNIPLTFYEINKTLNVSHIQEYKLCEICESVLDAKKKCPSETCLSPKNLMCQRPINVFILDIESQIKFILNNHYDTICSYTKKLNNGDKIYDIISGKSSIFKENRLNLILFADGVNYTKSSKKTIWVLLSSIVELPQFLRESSENIIAHSMWSGSNPDFNIFLKHYNEQTTSLLEKGLIFRGKKIDFKIHLFIADSPARSRVCKTKYFNGKYGCLFCMHPTTRIDSTTVYPNLPCLVRTNKMYNEQVKEAELTNEPFKGIKERSFLSNWITIPDSCLLDYIHLSCIGAFKQIFNMLFDSNNHKEAFYLENLKGRRISLIDKTLINVKLPCETSKNTRSVTEKSFFKANEYRNLLFYLAFGIFKDVLPDLYLKNMMKFIIFIRILCLDGISLDDINDSILIIQDFISEFEKLYGKKSMTSNIHGHQHLPYQVWHFGPLNKRSCFPFENKFKDTRNTFHGTRNFDGQIARNLVKKQKICAELKIFREKSLNKNLNDFIDHNLNSKSNTYSNRILNPNQQNFSQMEEFEKNLILKNNILSKQSTFLVGSCARINSKNFHTLSYDKRFYFIDYSSIQYQSFGKSIYGIILKFLNSDGKNFCIIQKFESVKSDIFLNNLDKLCKKHIGKFFNLVKLIDDFEIVEWDSNIKRIIIIKYKENFIISNYDDSTEKD